MDPREELKELIQLIRLRTGKSQSQVSIEVGLKPQRLASVVAKWKGHQAYITLLKTVYKDVIEGKPVHAQDEVNPLQQAINLSSRETIASLSSRIAKHHKMMEVNLKLIEEKQQLLSIQLQTLTQWMADNMSMGEPEQAGRILDEINKRVSEQMGVVVQMDSYPSENRTGKSLT